MNKEQILQAKCTQWFNNTHLAYSKCLFAVNNNAINAAAGAILRAIGVRAGVSDLVLILPAGRVLWIELKTDTGKQSPDQVEFESQVAQLGHTYLICRDFENFKEIVNLHFETQLP